MEQPKDILIRTRSADLLAQTLEQLPGIAAVVVGGPDHPVRVDGCWVVRVFGGLDFLKFAFAQQGYGEVVRELEALT